MKKVLTVLAIMAIAMGMVFAADGPSVSQSAGAEGSLTLDGSKTATLNVKFTPSDDMAKFFEIGFSALEVTQPSTGVPSVTPTADLVLEASDTMGDEASGSVYVYWIIKGVKVNIEMEAGANLSNIDDLSNTIKWKASVGDSATESGKSSSIVVNGSTPIDATSSEDPLKIGSTQVTVSTVDIAETAVTTKEYSSSLTLSIKSAE